MTHKNGYLKAYRGDVYSSYKEALESGAIYNIGIQGMDFDRAEITDLIEVSTNTAYALGGECCLVYVFVIGDQVEIF